MRLLLDQDVYAATAQFLSDLGHDVLTVAQIGLAQAEDESTKPSTSPIQGVCCRRGLTLAVGDQPESALMPTQLLSQRRRLRYGHLAGETLADVGGGPALHLHPLG
jgi:hypothetical protein